VKTAFGWHVIKVEDRRAEAPAGFFEMRARLQEEMTREMMDEVLRALRERAEIELYPKAERTQ
ncbi:MAG: peptidylprolyl isomerase, partial [Proteobacteria bacterium]|nr:peptidylprolyl isomerase [Pseudomonadota bacterium]